MTEVYAEWEHQSGMWTGARVRELRKLADLSQSDLARLLSRVGRQRCDPGTVSRWERGVEGVSAFYGRQLTAVARMLLPEDEAVKRRTFLELAALGLTGFVDLERLVSPVTDSAWLESAESVTLALANQHRRVPAASLLPSLIGHLRGLEQRLPKTAELTAKAALLTGVAFADDGGRRTEAYRHYALAVDLGSDAVRAKALNAQATCFWMWGDRTTSLAYQDRAVQLGNGAPRLLAGLLARRAELHAENGSDVLAMRDLEAARMSLTGGYEWFYMGCQNDVELGAYQGCVEMALGRHREAASTLQWVYERMDPTLINWRTRVAADRDRALSVV